MHNLLTQPLITTASLGALTLPGVLAALSRDAVEGFPALRPHQRMFWHMFLAQVSAMALARADAADLPGDEETWCGLLRGLTPDFPDDEPWHLVVDDWSRPAFLQPPVPAGVKLGNVRDTPDALDLLITSKNHDLKQGVARDASVEDWLFALISLQTGEGYGGAGNQGIVRMNGGSSSRPMLGLAPLPDERWLQSPRPGAWFQRDVRAMLAEGNKGGNDHGFAPANGLGLIWLADWPEGEQLPLATLDRWFVEVCRRVRMRISEDRLTALAGTSAATRIAAKDRKGAIGDPWAPVHKAEGKSLTLGSGDFDYRRISELLFSGDWELPLAMQPLPGDQRVTLVAQAISRGNSKTEGFKSRIIPISTRTSGKLGRRPPELAQLAKEQTGTITTFIQLLKGALALVAAGGISEKRKKDHYNLADDAAANLDRYADSIFFETLWARFDAQEEKRDADAAAAKTAFVRALNERTQAIFAAALPTTPCPSLLRPKAEVSARRYLRGSILENFGDHLRQPATEQEEVEPDAAR